MPCAAPLGRQHRGKTPVTAGHHGVEHTNAAAKVFGKVSILAHQHCWLSAASQWCLPCELCLVYPVQVSEH